jgi:hypothetical protein
MGLTVHLPLRMFFLSFLLPLLALNELVVDEGRSGSLLLSLCKEVDILRCFLDESLSLLVSEPDKESDDERLALSLLPTTRLVLDAGRLR